MKFIFFSKRTYWIALGLLLILFATTLYHRIAHFDDAWMTEQSYWIIKDGYARSELFRGYNYWHERLYVFHKAFVYLQAPVVYVLGCSIWAARTLPMLFSGVTLLLLVLYFRRRLEQQWLATILYLGCGCLWLFGVDNRPETMVVTFGFASFFLLRYADRFPKTVLVAGILAGIAGLTHLNGIVFIATGSLWLLARGSWKKAFWFGVAGGLTVSLYLADAVGDGQLDRLVYQFTNDHAAKANFHGWGAKLKLMSRYHRLFFHSDGEAPLTILFLATILILILGKSTRRLLTPSMHYLLLMTGVFWLLTKSVGAYYYLLFVPFLIVAVVDVVFLSAPKLARWQYQAIVFVFCLYPLGGVARAYYLGRENRTDSNIMTENALLASYMPHKGVNVIAPIDFFFGQMPKYKIHSLTYFQLVAPDNPPPLDNFFSTAARDSVRYIICDYRQWNQAYHIPRNAPIQIGGYKRIFQDKWRGIYEWQPQSE